MDSGIPIFKHWAPEWLIRASLFLLILPNIVLFFLPLANINAAAGFYGSEPADIQFAVALFYAGYVGFYNLERRFFVFLATREYFIIITFLQILSCFICYQVHELYIFFPIRFLQGLLFACTVNLSLSLMFTRLQSERAREVGFSVFFGFLLCAVPFNNFVTADLIDAYNFGVVYKATLFAYAPCLFLLLLTMNNVRLNVRFPLWNLDWQSFALYTIVLVLLGYIMIYGQEYYWLQDLRIRNSVMVIGVLAVIYLVRQWKMRRPYLHLQVFRYRNFRMGLVVLFVMYICRFASGITNSFYTTVLGFDPFHVSYINLLNMGGIVVGVIIACCMALQKMRIRRMWIPGFVCLLGFHVSMYFLFDVQADEWKYFIPLFVQGLGVGMIMVPTIIYIISSVPVAIGGSAASIGLLIRYLGFCVSIALINYFELLGRSRHYNAFQDHLTKIDPVVRATLHKQAHILETKGMPASRAIKGANKMLVASLNKQDQIRFAMDYYELISCLIVATLLLIALWPYLNRTVVYLRSRRLSPA
ncbi:beta-carotene 15,15'-monooxygenase [Chitinophaga silvatica]|uniref:Beta-carotene 15,15'-monooxygenase n=1 Tax=Chitinophaga silvatica TaxID=2282649 RepID=A0A3E1Y7N6_9BACT|nr:beta-carotene 15,15'-monooxygenase [Chitinophaga silvatica]RFS21062.1 beta-carotene 15,15'-monooxygenase [Chitinophaga silvatica]